MTDAATAPVRLLRDGAVATILFNRPQALNALDVPTAEAFHAACRTLAADPSVRAVLLRGAGRSFGVGGDLAAMRDGGASRVAQALIDSMHAACCCCRRWTRPSLSACKVRWPEAA